MHARGRPRILTDSAIIKAGARITLPNVTVRAIARALRVSEMSVYRRTGGLKALRLLIADGIVENADFTLSDHADPEEALIDVAVQLRDFVLANPGIAEHLANLGPAALNTLSRIEEAQAEFATRHRISPAQASILLSTVAEHAVALAAWDPRSHRETRDAETISAATPTIRAGVAAVSRLSPEEHFIWSIRATARGALALLGLPTRHDLPHL